MLLGTEAEFRLLEMIHDIFESRFTDFIMPRITALGNAGIIWIILAAVLLCIPRYRRCGAVLAAGLLAGLVFGNLLIKPLIHRPRPCWLYEVQLITKIPSDYSFPSGHAGSAFAVAVVVFLMCPRKIGVPVLVFAFVIAFSRLYVGVHFPTDVLGGALIGAVIAYLVCAVYRRKTGQKHAL
mgnify:CR=1 FL=1